ncbi:MAG: 3D domain-containing protein [candidate division WOR-3 bacterium]
MKIFFFFFLFLIFSCAPLQLVTPPTFIIRPVEKELPVTTAKFLGEFQVTYYWIVKEEDYSGKRTTPLYLSDGKLLGYFPYKFVRDFKIESCGQLKDGRLISWLKRQQRVKIVDKFLGNGYFLTPLKSLASDPNVLPLGLRVFIPSICKMKIGEKVHSGIFYTHDIGSKIIGKKIDIFVGEKENIKYFSSVNIKSGQKVELYLLE